MSEYKGMGRSRKRKETMASRICGKMKRMKRFLSTAVCVSMIGSSVLNPAMLVYADSDEEEVQEFELESEAIGQAITEAIADDSLVSAEDLGFSGTEEETYAELFAEDGLLYEVKPEIDETKDDDGDLDLRIFVRLDVVELLDEGETLDGYEITGEEDVFFMLVNDTDTEQNAIVIVDGKETDVITVAPESEVAETVADEAEIVISDDEGSVGDNTETSEEESEVEVSIQDEDETTEEESADETEAAELTDDTEDAEPTDDTEDVESEDDTEDAGSEEDTEDVESEDDTEDAGSEEDTEDVESEDDMEDAGSEEDTEDVESEDDTEDTGSEEDTGDVDSEDDTEDAESADDTEDAGSTDADSDIENDTSYQASISVHKYSLVALAASPADAEESEVEVVVSEDSGLLDGELYEAVAMEDGAAVVFVTTTEELGLKGLVSGSRREQLQLYCV